MSTGIPNMDWIERHTHYHMTVCLDEEKVSRADTAL